MPDLYKPPAVFMYGVYSDGERVISIDAALADWRCIQCENPLPEDAVSFRLAIGGMDLAPGASSLGMLIENPSLDAVDIMCCSKECSEAFRDREDRDLLTIQILLGIVSFVVIQWQQARRPNA